MTTLHHQTATGTIARRCAEAASLLLVAALFTACATRPPVPGQTDEIGFRINGVLVEFDRKVGGKWNAIVQEVQLDDGSTLVECFRINPDARNFIYDRHEWSSETEVRTMKVYLAVVEGAHWTHNGFAHLPANMDGSVKTTVGKGFNASYQHLYETRGKITAASAEYLTWRIDGGAHRLVVEAP